ncbi:hypothetical protein FA15DRAFT_414646 [Coprinopsis marcescibilis]|uniref:Uncharacterized protein n=1 Tax=Coprinopsis marcescibilis TaxID=230819 RepID=A0A5C3K9V6_COPMA|nr:hypothetical protein FA15DRAFT_414646 [Coprinopsis marcescibilis]
MQRAAKEEKEASEPFFPAVFMEMLLIRVCFRLGWCRTFGRYGKDGMGMGMVCGVARLTPMEDNTDSRGIANAPRPPTACHCYYSTASYPCVPGELAISGPRRLPFTCWARRQQMICRDHSRLPACLELCIYLMCAWVCWVLPILCPCIYLVWAWVCLVNDDIAHCRLLDLTFLLAPLPFLPSICSPCLPSS